MAVNLSYILICIGITNSSLLIYLVVNLRYIWSPLQIDTFIVLGCIKSEKIMKHFQKTREKYDNNSSLYIRSLINRSDIQKIREKYDYMQFDSK